MSNFIYYIQRLGFCILSTTTVFDFRTFKNFLRFYMVTRFVSSKIKNYCRFKQYLQKSSVKGLVTYLV